MTGRLNSFFAALLLLTGNALFGDVARYVAEFNAADEELYTNTVPNSAAAGFLAANVPLLECPDPDVERAYYFRWWTFRKHLKKKFGLKNLLPNKNRHWLK